MLVKHELKSKGQKNTINRSIIKNQQHTLKAITLRDFSDVYTLREDIKKNMIIILRITPLAQKNPDELKKAVDEICDVATKYDADIARLGEERIIIVPPTVNIWKPEKSLK